MISVAGFIGISSGNLVSSMINRGDGRCKSGRLPPPAMGQRSVLLCIALSYAGIANFLELKMELDPRTALKRSRIIFSDRKIKRPEEVYPNAGYGLNYPTYREPEAAQFARIRDFIQSGDPESEVVTRIGDLRSVSEYFARAATAHRPDWFYRSYKLGHPSHLLSRMVTEKLADLQVHIASGEFEAAEEELQFLSSEAVADMLDNYLILSDEKSRPPEPEQGWAYLAWRPDYPNSAFVGSGEGTMHEILTDLTARERTKGLKFGLLSAWLVHDPEHADRTIHDLWAAKPSANGRYNSVNFDRAAKSIEGALLATDNLVLSPWHIDDDMAFDRLGMRQTAAPDQDDDEAMEAPATTFSA
jgi:hypothetical protein